MVKPPQPAAEPPLFPYIRENELGADLSLETPFGTRPILYADYTASGRALGFVEDYVRDAVLPTYGNTHTLASKTGRQSSSFVAEARQMIKEFLKCNSDRAENADQLVFVGSGATACANQLVRMLGLATTPAGLAAARALPAAQRPIVFVGPYEHHSNLLPWRDSIAEVVQLPEAADGGPDLARLEAELVAARERPLRIGAFSAASNVTGTLTDADAVTELLHAHGALAVWDYATAAPYVAAHMNPPHADPTRAAARAKDALFFSPHKLAGGPQTPGVLVFKKALAERGTSSSPGGGSIFFVGREKHVYLKAAEEREEARAHSRSMFVCRGRRAPCAHALRRALAGGHAVDRGRRARRPRDAAAGGGGRRRDRAGARARYSSLGTAARPVTSTPSTRARRCEIANCYTLSEAAGRRQLLACVATPGAHALLLRMWQAERRILAAAREAWATLIHDQRLVLLGTARDEAPRLPIFAFAVRVGGLYLHYNFVVALLADLFGVQCRGGCMCAGPYSLQLLGIGGDLSDRYQARPSP